MKNILIIVDVQYGFARYEQTKEMANKIIDLSNAGVFDKIIATKFINKEGSQYTEFLNWHRLMDSPDIDIVEGIKADYIFEKNIYTSVNEKFLEVLRQANEGEIPKTVFICGVDTECCVLKIAVDLFEVGIKPLVLCDYVASNGGLESHKAGILAMSRLIGKKSLICRNINTREDVEDIIKIK